MHLDLIALQMPQGAEWLIIGLLILLLFGAKKLPDAARGLGRSMRILKTETKGLRDDYDDGAQENQAAAPEQITDKAEAKVDLSEPTPDSAPATSKE